MKRLACLLFVGLSVAACTIGEDSYETVTYAARLVATKRVCDSPFTVADTSSKKACGDGKGHCYDPKKISMSGFTTEGCDGGDVCAPDTVLASKGEKLKSCTFYIGNKPGACLSPLLTEIKANLAQMKQDACDDGEVCAPCVDPRDGKSWTGACDGHGAHEEACTGGAGGASEGALCCHGAGTCISADAVPEDKRDNLSRETCHGNQVCAPRSMVSGKPVKCETLGIADGVCMDICFASMLRSVAKVSRSTCGPTEVCIPCLVGKGQGMPGCD